MHTEIDDFLAHYGVLGMKWGVRKNYDAYKEKVYTESPGAKKTRVVSKTGDVLTVEKGKPGPIQLAVAKLTRRKPSDNISQMTIKNKDGQKVGGFQIWKEGNDTVRGEWLEIKSDYQGRGYSEASIRGLIKASRSNKGIKQVKLQVPSDAEAAKHIYSKIGFVKTEDLGYDPVYGNLEDWTYKL